jgi:hypothetical protein
MEHFTHPLYNCSGERGGAYEMLKTRPRSSIFGSFNSDTFSIQTIVPTNNCISLPLHLLSTEATSPECDDYAFLILERYCLTMATLILVQ